MKASTAERAAARAHWRWLALPSLCAALAGCAHYVPQPIDPKAEAVAFDSRTLGSGPWSLLDLQAEAEQHNPDLVIARAQRKAAEAAAITAGARPNPALSTSAQKNTSAERGSKAWTYDLGLGIPVETAGKRDIRMAQTAWQAQAAAYAEAEALWRVRGRVREAYIGAFPVEQQTRERAALQASLSEEIQKRLNAGMVSSSEVLQARLAARQAELAVEDAHRRRIESLHKLAASISVPERALENSRLPFNDLLTEALPSAAVIDKAAKTALQARPDVLASLAAYEASQTALQLEIAKQYPDLSIGPGYAWEAGALKWSLALGVMLPLLDRNQGPIAEAEAKREEAAASCRATQEQAVADIAAARAAYAQSRRQLALAQAMVDDQAKRLRSAELAFRAGATDRLALLAAQVEASAAQSTHTDALLDAHRTAGLLETALRQSLTSPFARPSSKGQP